MRKQMIFSEIGLEKILSLYVEIDYLSGQLKKNCFPGCPELCGTCCNTSAKNVEASVLEVLPLALNLWETGQWEFILSKLAVLKEDDPCVFYKDEIAFGNAGRCGVYELRPLVCRLFGYSAVINKYGETVIALCQVIKKAEPGCEVLINSLIKNGMRVPVFSEYAMRASMLNPAAGMDRFPINSAVKKAIEMAGLRLDYCIARGNGSESPDNLPPLKPEGRKCA